MDEPDSGHKPKLISAQEASYRTGVTRETVVAWCRKYGIGRQLSPRSPWRIDPIGLEVVQAGDLPALVAFQQGDYRNPALTPYRMQGRAQS